MNDQPAPFSPFAPVPQPVAPIFDPAPAGQGKKKRGKPRDRGVKARPAPAGKKPRAKKAAEAKPAIVGRETALLTPARKRAARKARPATIPIGILPALAGLKETEAAELMRLVTELQAWAKKPRSKIVMALAKVFA